ncbi:MAG: hypothetical protein KDA80_01160 [Planctomycetaceae bacterium]|nr:hypothetical protein [Planctomycetaceae bacterium]
MLILLLLLIPSGCGKPRQGLDKAPAGMNPSIPPPSSALLFDREVDGVYRYRAAPNGDRRAPPPDGPEAVIEKMRQMEFDAVLLNAPTGQDGQDQCTRVAVRCNPLGSISNHTQEVPWCYNYTFIPDTNLVYGIDQGLCRVDTTTGKVERLLDATDYALRAPFDSKRRELVLITRSTMLTKFHVDTDDVSKTEAAGFPSVSYPMAYDATSDRFLRLDPGSLRDGTPDIQLHEFDVDRTHLSTRKISSHVPVSLDKIDGWESDYDALVMDGHLILIVRRTPVYEKTECQNICHVIDLSADKVVFSAEMVPQPASDPPSREKSEGLPADQALAKASVNGKFQDLITTIFAPEDDLIHTTFREFGEYTGTQWRGYDLPRGFYVYVYPRWYVWQTQLDHTIQEMRSPPYPDPPFDEPQDPLIEKAWTAYEQGDEETATAIWESILEEPATPHAWYCASIALAVQSAKNDGIDAAIQRLEPLGRQVLGQPTNVPYDIPTNHLKAVVLNLLKSSHAELGQYEHAAIYAEAVKGTYYDTCGTYQTMYEADAIAEAKRFRQWAADREYHPSPRFTEMINGMTIANGRAAKTPVLEQLSRFQRVVFERAKLNDGGTALLENLPQLEGIVCFDTQLTDLGLWSLSKLSKLEELVIPDAQITDEGARYLANLPKLRVLNLMSSPITNEAARAIGSLKRLTHLELSHTKITDAGMAHLAGLTRLEHFGFPHQNVTGQGLVHLSKMHELKSVYLGCASISPQEMAPLANLRSLERLNIQTRTGAGPGLVHLQGLSNLKELTLSDPTIESHHLAALKRMPIEFLSLWGTAADDGCIDVVLSLRSLKRLQANGLRKLTPAGIRRLRGHPSLAEISLTDYCIPEAERTPLQEAMVPIQVTYFGN